MKYVRRLWAGFTFRAYRNTLARLLTAGFGCPGTFGIGSAEKIPRCRMGPQASSVVHPRLNRRGHPSPGDVDREAAMDFQSAVAVAMTLALRSRSPGNGRGRDDARLYASLSRTGSRSMRMPPGPIVTSAWAQRDKLARDACCNVKGIRPRDLSGLPARHGRVVEAASRSILEERGQHLGIFLRSTIRCSSTRRPP